MGQESELQRLERFVAKLLTSFSELRAEKSRLVQQLGERNAELEALRSRLVTEEAERGEIGQRVGKLVEQIEEWERSLDESAAVATPVAETEGESHFQVPAQAEYETQTVYEAQDEDEVQEKVEAGTGGEEDVRVQHNLFSLTGTQR